MDKKNKSKTIPADLLKIVENTVKNNSTELNIDVRGSLELLKEICLITNLKYLKLENVNILPEDICRLKKLEKLEILNSEKLQIIPKEIGQLTKLKYLEIRSTSINVLPDEIGNLVKLTILNIIGNINLRSLPKTIGNLVNLKELCISSNTDEKNELQIPKEIGKLINLNVLELVKNNLKAIPKEIGKLENLKDLTLFNNKIKTISKDILSMRNLRYLGLRTNPITELPKEICNLTNLRDIALKNCPIENVPENIINEGVKAIFKYLKSDAGSNKKILKKESVENQSLSPIFDAAHKMIRSSKIPLLKSEESIYYYDVKTKRSVYAEEIDSSVYQKCFDYFIKASFIKGTKALGVSKLGGYPHLSESWIMPKDKNWKGLQFYAQLNIDDFKKYDVEVLFPSQGIIYIFVHPEEARAQIYFESNPKIKLVVRKDLQVISSKEQYFTFTPNIIFHAEDAADDKNVIIPKKLKDDLEKLFKAKMTYINPAYHIFGRPQFWQGEDEGRGPSPKSVLLFQGVIEDEDVTFHIWIDREAIKTGDFSSTKMTFSGS